MTIDELARLGKDISAGLKSQQSRQVKTVLKPAILDEPAPKEFNLTWIEARAAAETEYTTSLLSAGTLSAAEASYLAGRVSKFLRQTE
jgi:hypothetical protein